jgi:hypothetical protein
VSQDAPRAHESDPLRGDVAPETPGHNTAGLAALGTVGEMEDFSGWSRPIPGQDRRAVEAYVYDEYRDNGQRQRSALAHVNHIRLWLWGIDLFAGAYPPFVGSRSYSSNAATAEEAENQHYWTRQSLLMLAGRSMKPALDLLLSCYYTETWSLLRSSLDGWGRAVFVRLQPEDYTRWVRASEDDEADENGEEAATPKKGPDWPTIEEAICNHGTEGDRAAFDAALLRWRFLHLGVHPSGTGLTQTHDEELNIMTFRPDYEPNMTTASLCIGVFVQRVLLDEVVRLDNHPAAWRTSLTRFLDQSSALAGCIKRVLEREARELEAERSRNPKRLKPCVRRRWYEEHPVSS